MAIINEINEYNKRKVQPSVTSGNLAAQSQQLPSLVPEKASGGNSTLMWRTIQEVIYPNTLPVILR